MAPEGRTIFEGVKRLREGGFLEYDLHSNSTNLKKYFVPADWVDKSLYNELDGCSEGKLLKIYEDAFDDSLQKHVISDAPLGTLFSAGLDSSIVTRFALKYRKIDLYHYESELLNLLHYAQSFAKKFNLKLIITKGNDANFIFEMPHMLNCYETVGKEEGVVLSYLCRLARKDGIKVLLTGDAGDELFMGYRHHSEFYIKDSLNNSAITAVLVKAINHFFPKNILKYRFISPVATDYSVFPPNKHFNEIPLNCLYHRGERLADWQKCLEAYSFVKDKTQRETLAYLLDEVGYRLQRMMIRTDRFGMKESVELRTPFLHPVIVRLALNTPIRWRLKPKIFGRGYETKHIIRRLAIKQSLPYGIVYRKKLTTPHNSLPQRMMLIKNWELKNVNELLEISSSTLKKILLESFDPGLARAQYSFLSMEILIRIFIKKESPYDIEQEFRQLLT